MSKGKVVFIKTILGTIIWDGGKKERSDVYLRIRSQT